MAIHSQVSHKSKTPVPVLFLDRDGVLIVDRHYLSEPDDVNLIPGVCEALMEAKKAGFFLIGVSNQSGIGRELFTLEDFNRVMAKMEDLLAARGVALDGFYFCPHAPDDQCACRKPLPGLLDEAGKSFQWDPEKSWIVGDKISDIRLGRNNGMGAVLVDTGYGLKQKDLVQKEYQNDSLVLFAPDLRSAVDAVLSKQAREDDS